MPASKVVVHLPDAPSFDVRIGPSLASQLGQRIVCSVADVHEAILITDTNVGPLYLQAIHDTMKAAGLRVTDITIPAGKGSKTAACVAEIWAAMARAQVDDYACVVALGGSVVCDVAGFVAATYNFGLPLVLVPTSLSAMANASFSNMAGLNVADQENRVGTFAQVAYVCASTDMLTTLPEEDWQRGCEEVASIAYAESGEFEAWYEQHAQALAQRNADVVEEAIVHCVVAQANALV